MEETSTAIETPNERESFGDAYGAALQALRAALESAVRSAGGDPERPQDLARAFTLNKNLTWKVSRLIGSDDPAAALRFIPGAAGLRKVRDSLATRISEGILCELDEALLRFDEMVTRHAGDRGSLELLVQGVAHDRVDAEAHEQARRLAFQGNSAIWGVQARVQQSVQIVAPNPDQPRLVDVCTLGGLHDFRRMRPETTWLLFASEQYEVGDGATVPPRGRSLLGGNGPDSLLLRDHCSSPTPQLQVVELDNTRRFRLPAGPIGNLGQMTVCYGMIDREAGDRVADNYGDPSERAELGLNLLTPCELLQLDVLLHDDLRWDQAPRIELWGRIEGHTSLSDRERKGRSIPYGESLIELGRGAACMSSSAVPRNVELVEQAMGHLEWDASKFRAWRFTMPFPPIPATLAFVIPLAAN
ncbi:MAG: hypothetical protein AAFZ65_03410 [Planctomycetota bacterium]